ncbi:Oidioi.mRNA.OKI2018_I69.chr2.g6508.t1.cds [Oikopleura dioica]|uniref:Oidioi.mRNA.OKI2018_I69.chr2.g6508.t1.cds n=1 Tax=Oikopleura dioica TaxID=34765 RepID=A0ABN7T3B9_OIKDI|nr:Oidioi.mRNA.OKI2018_I69.chr2.g6508.t1.cds [Oikopleura dioica]
MNFAAFSVLCKLFRGSYDRALYTAYSSFYGISTCLTLAKSDLLTSEGLLPLFTFVYLQYFSLSLHAGDNEEIRRPLQASFTSSLILLFYMKSSGIISPLSEENAIYLNPSLPKTNPPALASSQNAQPSAWAALFFDNHYGAMILPIGLSILSKKNANAALILTVYAVIALYLAAVKTSNQILLVPVVSITSGLTLCHIIQLSLKTLKNTEKTDTQQESKRRMQKKYEEINFPMKRFFAGAAGTLCAAHLIYAARHGVWVTQNIYSDATIFVTAATGDGRALIFDDFRESYSWLKHNTPEESKIAAWWDYGYQINQLAERGTLADNSAWNKTSIAEIGKAFASGEEQGWSKLRHLGADYVYVQFGGQVGYSKDDINKFLWMLRLADSEHVTGEFNQKRYKNVNNEFRVDIEGAQTWLNSLLYKLSYYRYGGQNVQKGKPSGWDRVRKAEIGNKDFELEFFEEVYTSSRWLLVEGQELRRLRRIETLHKKWDENVFLPTAKSINKQVVGKLAQFARAKSASYEAYLDHVNLRQQQHEKNTVFLNVHTPDYDALSCQRKALSARVRNTMNPTQISRIRNLIWVIKIFLL